MRTTRSLMESITGIQTTDEPSMQSYFRQVLVLFLSSFSIILLTSQVTDLKQPTGSYFGQSPPGAVPERFAKGIIPDDLHSIPVFSADGKTVYYKPLDNTGIMVMKMKQSKWSKAIPLFVNDEVGNSDDPCISHSGNSLYFSSYNKEQNREYIYYCDQEDTDKCIPQKPSGELNTLDLHWQFSVTGNGNVYFSSNGNIYCSVFSSGTYEKPYKLDSGINSDYSECTPYVSQDENMMIFSRSNADKPDLFISTKGEDGKWQKARKLGPGINTAGHEMCPYISPDGKYFFFLSSREGLFSAYWVNANVLSNS
ncbi:MAG: hypothetical protein ABFS05_05535 [Bacteroidota bacterium]